jgi:HD-like signal output (HDOD) protein
MAAALRPPDADPAFLPVVESVREDLLNLLQTPDTSDAAIIQCILTDPALAANILAEYNEGREAESTRTVSLGSAIADHGLLGLGRFVTSLPCFQPVNAEHHAWREYIRLKSIAARTVADIFSDALQPPSGEALMLGAALHEIGKLFFDTITPAAQSRLPHSRTNHDHLEHEAALFGTDHLQAGALLAQNWDYPAILHDVVRWHGIPDDATNHALHVAIAGLAVEIVNASEEIRTVDLCMHSPAFKRLWKETRRPPGELADLVKAARAAVQELRSQFVSADLPEPGLPTVTSEPEPQAPPPSPVDPDPEPEPTPTPPPEPEPQTSTSVPTTPPRKRKSRATVRKKATRRTEKKSLDLRLPIFGMVALLVMVLAIPFIFGDNTTDTTEVAPGKTSNMSPAERVLQQAAVGELEQCEAILAETTDPAIRRDTMKRAAHILLYQVGDYTRAESYLKQLAEAYTDWQERAAIHLDLATCYERTGKRSAARGELRVVMELAAPGSPEHKAARAQLFPGMKSSDGS